MLKDPVQGVELLLGHLGTQLHKPRIESRAGGTNRIHKGVITLARRDVVLIAPQANPRHRVVPALAHRRGLQLVSLKHNHILRVDLAEKKKKR